jgi:ABC-type Fe3+-siderophore transport system permease subunit
LVLSRVSRAWVIGWGLLAVMVAWQLFVRLSPATLHGLQVDVSIEALLQTWVFWPRLAAGLVVGACLGSAGALMQLITRNPLVSPDLLGITAGAQLGVILGLMLPASLGLPLIFVGGTVAALLTFFVAGGWNTSALRLTLAGVGIAQCLGAFIALFLSLNDHAAMVVSLWNTGSLQQFGWTALTPAWLLVPLAAIVLVLLARPLNLTVLGDAQMRSLGVTPTWIKAVSIILGTLLTALAFQLAGPLGLIGLITPNLLRLVLGVTRPSSLVPLCALWGAGLTLFADNFNTALSQWVSVPFGVLSALLGSVAILVLLRLIPRAPSAAIARVEGQTVARRLPLPVFVGLMMWLCAVLMVLGVTYGDSTSGFIQAWWSGDEQARTLLNLRMPRLLVDLIAGACFALSGMMLQTVTRNPLAGPEILGVSQTSALAVLLALVLVPQWAGDWRFPIAWVGAIAALVLVIGLNIRHGLEPLRLTLTGFAVGGASLALISFLIAQFSTNVAQAMIWMVGSSYGRTWADVIGMMPWVVLGVALCAAAARWMDLLQLGDGVAKSLGLAVVPRRAMLVAIASLLVAVPVAVVGPVAFVGLLVPHGVRLLGYYRTVQRLWAAPWLGATLLMSADFLGRLLLAPLDIPLGIMTAAIGAPCFLWLLSRTYAQRRQGA